jgi:glycosyltransferase involved in cell wall biosynthesis
MRIDQLIPAIIEHDAVSNHTFEAQRLLRELGYASEIYASILGPGTVGRVRPIAELPRAGAPRDWLLYQCSIGSPVAEIFAAYPARKLLDYHNITPAELVERWIPPLAAEARLGRRQLRELAPVVDAALADSAFNASELDTVGFAHTSVAPILVEAGNLSTSPDPELLAKLRRERATRWLFVGQVAPHKAQHDILRAFACYRAVYDPRARLCIVGREMGSAYRDAVERFAASIGLRDAVEFTGSVPTASLAAYYEAADVFVCLSDHEGFCAPIIEAMARGVPVVAFAAAAVPDTVGGAGVLLSSKAPELVAAAVHELVVDDGARGELVAAGFVRARQFSLDAARTAFRREIQRAVTG